MELAGDIIDDETIEILPETLDKGPYFKIKADFDDSYERSKENVKKLIDWMLSDEGQYIIEQTGYVGLK